MSTAMRGCQSSDDLTVRRHQVQAKPKSLCSVSIAVNYCLIIKMIQLISLEEVSSSRLFWKKTFTNKIWNWIRRNSKIWKIRQVSEKLTTRMLEGPKVNCEFHKKQKKLEFREVGEKQSKRRLGGPQRGMRMLPKLWNLENVKNSTSQGKVVKEEIRSAPTARNIWSKVKLPVDPGQLR